MLHFNAKGAGPHAGSRVEEEVYKVLILDGETKNIVAPLLRVDELRHHGVTLHMQLHSDRQPIPDVSAVYFVQPTEENVKRIATDAGSALYDSFYVNFSSTIPRPLLENMASLMVERNASIRVAQVYDQHTNFISLEPGLFSLGMPNAYLDLNDPKARDTMIEGCINSVVDGILSMLVTTAVVPFVCCPPGGAAEHVARTLDGRLRQVLQDRSNLFNEGAGIGLSNSLQRPLLCLFDRNFELSVAVQHAWTYKPLVHDTLGLKLNRTAPGSYLNGKSYEMSSNDLFWQAHGNEQFPKIAEEVENELKEYKSAVEELNKSTGANIDPNNVVDPSELMSNSTKGLKTALTTLPQLTERKRNIDKHTNIATGLLQVIKERKLDHLYSLEEDCVGGKGNISDILDRLKASEGTSVDKIRLALVWLLTSPVVPSDADCQSIEACLNECGADMDAWIYVKRMRRMKLTGKSQVGVSEGSTGAGGAQFAADFLGSTFGQGLTSLTKGVKDLLSGEQQAAVTVAVESLMDGKPNPDVDDYLMFDPKSAATAPKKRTQQSFREAVVFIIGGGNYLEWGSLGTWAARSQPIPKSIIYGATDILTGEEMVQQLGDLGRRSSRV